jgi:hypothetical protein
MHSYDIREQEFHPPAIDNVVWQFHQGDSHAIDFKVEPCDLLFIDGCHKYDSVKADLRQAAQTARFIIMHDTSEERDKVYGDGVCRAMREFLKENPIWEIVERHINCNGLTVMERKA